MADAPLLLIAAGGTGGHMFPAQALAEAMLKRGWRVRLSTDARGARYTGAFPSAVAIGEVSSATFARGGAAAKLLVPFRIAGGILSAIAAFRRDRPAVVVGFGGYPTIPALAAAWVLRLPRLIHEQNGVLGRVNRLFARRVHRVACGTALTALPGGVAGVHTGNPVRAAVLERAGAPYLAPGAGALRLVVLGGSQGARILSDRVPAALARLRRRCAPASASPSRRARKTAPASPTPTPGPGSPPRSRRSSTTCPAASPRRNWSSPAPAPRPSPI